MTTLTFYLSTTKIYEFELDEKTKTIKTIFIHSGMEKHPLLHHERLTYTGIAQNLAYYMGYNTEKRYDLLQLLDVIREEGFHADMQVNLRLEII